MPGTLFVVATPIGNLEDITLRALRVLREVAVIAAEDTRRTAHLLARHAISTPTTSLHEHNERQKSPSLIKRLLTGDSIALVSDAGTPTVSDPGAHLVRLAAEAGIRIEAIPGPSAVMAALSVSGLSTQIFAFFGFPPTRLKDRNAWFTRLISTECTVVFFEAPHRIRETMEELRRVAGDLPVLVTRELTKTHEQLVRGQISTVLDQLSDGRGEYTIVTIIGRKTEKKSSEPPSAEMLRREFGEITSTAGSSRRSAVATLAKRHGLTPNDVYRALETVKKSVV
jgi:16S rRNA (cytidine1402-2'-O)-methyltransferase